MASITKSISVDVDVDVDLDDFDDDEILEEAQNRGLDPYWEANDARGIAHQNMFRALSLGDEKQALDLLRNYLCDCLGRVL